jgi:Arc/MetJ family transcription regulator
MGINVLVDDDLIEQAKALTGQTDATAAVEQVLRAATQPKKTPLQGMLELAGQNLIRDDYDYKAMRAGGNDDVPR